MNPSTVRRLEKLGRVRLSTSFFLRDFLHSEIANAYGAPNIPDDPDLAIHAGRRLCEEILEPLSATFGRIAIRSAYRSSAINALGNRNKLGCASNEKNYARHIWDRRDADDCCGATACVVIPWFADRYAAGADWRSLAYWIHDHLQLHQANWVSGPTARRAARQRRADLRGFSASSNAPDEDTMIP